jgi:uncharacterized protein YcbX
MTGRIAGLWRYPVKSMGPEPLEVVAVAAGGLVGDRRWALVRPGLADHPFPWLTIRQRNDMASYLPAYDDPSDPDRSTVTVTTPAGARLPLTAPQLLTELLPGVTVRHDPAGLPDDSPLSIVTRRSLASLEALVGLPVDVQRLRPNVLVDDAGTGPWPEEDWVGRTVRLGDVLVEVTGRDPRCAILNVDPATAGRDPGYLRTLTREHDMCVGVYARVVTAGRFSVGDPVDAG